jgi:hypothetical protein
LTSFALPGMVLVETDAIVSGFVYYQVAVSKGSLYESQN